MEKSIKKIINSIVKFNVLNNLKSPMYFSILLFVICTYVTTFFGLSDNIIKNVNGSNMFIQYLLFVMQLSSFLMIFLTCVVSNFIAEKTSNRLEIYMSNGIAIRTIYYSYCWSAFLLSFFGVLILNVIIIVISIAIHVKILPILFEPKFIMLFIAITFLCFEITKLILALIMLIKKPITIRTVLNIATVLFLYFASYFGNPIIRLSGLIDFIILLSLLIFSIGLILFCLNVFLEKKITSEKIILSLKQ